MFTYTSHQFQEIIDFMLKEAKKRGATDAVAEVSEGQGLSVTVRKGEVETIEQSLDKQVGVTLFLGHHRGNASTSDFSKESLRQPLTLPITSPNTQQKIFVLGLQKQSFWKKIP